MKLSHLADKSDWPAGPWKDEPDRAQWIDENSGYDCLITRNFLGCLCGYVGVPDGHTLFGSPIERARFEVHGSVTFAGPCDPSEGLEQRPNAICHSGEVAHENVWWFGFDSSHSSDFAPAMASVMQLGDRAELHRALFGYVYRDFAYILEQVKHLASQLKDRASDETQTDAVYNPHR